MNSKQIESIFTAKVTEYIENGYIINLGTMAGSQGEIGKVDLRKGDEVIRLVLHDDTDFDHYTDIVVFTIGRVTMKRDDKAPFKHFCNTIWNHKLEIIEQRTWYKVSKRRDYYIESMDELEAIEEKREAREIARDTHLKVCNPRRDEALAVVLKYIRKQPKCSRKKVNDIQSVQRIRRGPSDLHYNVILNDGKCFNIR